MVLESANLLERLGPAAELIRDTFSFFFPVVDLEKMSLPKLDHTLARKNDSPTWCGVIVVVWCYCGGVVLLWWCGVTVVVWCYCGSVFVVV